ncbi:MAG: putative lipopolysaccharide heptosyltransferase III [Sterolibacteriaceae bacterium]|uniref:Lipopolysaccharide heptosyltransferase III n=1 Tax=Candidatus Methylophosphatis roskildensis TaxID=2899263 RepID=A0A9D7E1W5_9PROT|nr:putative lipopolysaccharide heptosyltransferase III [Candidatus Methylophosphatis roskildensis]
MIEDAVPLDRVRRALIIKLRHHGDVLLTSPVISVLKNHAPQAEIDALVYADTAPMLALHPSLAQLHTVDRNWKQAGALAQARAEWRLLSALRARRYDLIVHLTDHPRGAWLARLLGARHAVGPKRNDEAGWWRRSFTHRYAQVARTGRHTVERNLDALRRIGIQPGEDERALTLVAGEQAQYRVSGLLHEHGLNARGFIQLHPASRWLFKCWPVERNAALLDALHGDGWPVVLTAAPDQRERDMVAAIAASSRAPALDLAGQLSLKELAALTARARLFVGVDSAPMHIAAAVGTPVVALFGPSSDSDWGPWGVEARVVTSTRHACRPCGLDGCGGGKISECLTTLPIERVLQAVRELLAAR